ncbi:response regulator [Paenibacillus filicis]|uniref:Response regulator n=1 Tax=Paenibacillus filicis TaxID=669464 RepID=A0ABU9DIQ7_9BACL
MRRVLIVDDEKNIRLGLKAMIAREFPGVYAFEFAQDGQEALSLLTAATVDVVITDLRMPVMDGLALIKRIQELDDKPAVIILSGHDDFHYAQEAIRYQVLEYLLKPIVREELARTMLRLEKELAQREQVHDQLTGSVRQREAYRESQLSYLLRHPHLDDSGLREHLQGTDMEWLEEGFQLGALRYRGTVKTMGSPELLARIQAELENAPERFRMRRAHVWDKENQLVLIAEHSELFQFLAERIEGAGYFTYSMGMSEPTRGVTRIQAAYQEAVQALKYTFLQSAPGVVRYGSISGKSTEFVIPAETIRKIANMLGTDREKQMTALLMEVFDMKTVARYDISYLEGISQAFNELVFDKVFHVYGGESVEILRLFKTVGDIGNFQDFHDYYHNVERLLQRLNDYVRSMKAFHIDHKEMKRAVQYMQEHFHKDLNMTIVSNHVSLNYSYFSQAFKEYTGESFLSFLKKLRIDKARELLDTTEYKIYEISEMTGFENTKHFSRVFKELEGVSPQEYREQREAMRR